jgi:uncharacterized protein YciI
MQFIVIAYDDTQEGTFQRRLAAREAHLKLGKEMFDKGRWLYGAAISNDEGKTIGSMVVCDFPSRKEVEEQWLKNDPYIIGEVWKMVSVYRAQVPPFFMDKQDD